MQKLRAKLQRLDGSCSERDVRVSVEEHEGAEAVYVSAVSDCALDPECGVILTIGGMENVAAYMADFRHCEYWCKPFFGSDLRMMPPETQLLLWRETDGSFGVIVPLVSRQYKCVLCGTDEGLCAKLFSWYDKLNRCDAPAFVMARGEDPFALLENCVREGRRLLGGRCRAREERAYPELFEYLGWDSRDALHLRVSEEQLLKKSAELTEKGVPARWFLLDDMWGEVRALDQAFYHNYDEMLRVMRRGALYSFEADPKRFPHGLRRCVQALNAQGRTVGVWHPCTGYYRGVDPEGEAFRQCADSLFLAPGGEYLHAPQRDKAFGFYDAYHRFLESCGVKFVKIDNQSIIRRYYKGQLPLSEAADGIYGAMEDSALRHFDNRLINSMGLSSECVWNRAQSPVCRCGDDYIPGDHSCFNRLLLQCAYNSLLIGQFTYPDWDMWQTNDPQALRHSVLRAVSGGPVYISDAVGETRAEVLAPLMLSDGRVLRCDLPALPARDCLVENPEGTGAVFKLQNRCARAGVLAVFNLCRGARARGTVGPRDVEGLDGERFALYEHFSRSLTVLGREETLAVTLEGPEDFRLYIVVPLQNGFAPIGLAEKFISPKTFTDAGDTRVTPLGSGSFAYVRDGRLCFRPVRAMEETDLSRDS